MQDDKWQISKTRSNQSSWGEYTDEKTYGVTKTFGATPNHHNVGKARCERVSAQNVCKVNVCKVSEYARRQVENKRDEKQQGGHQRSWGEYTDEKNVLGHQNMWSDSKSPQCWKSKM